MAPHQHGGLACPAHPSRSSSPSPSSPPPKPDPQQEGAQLIYRADAGERNTISIAETNQEDKLEFSDLTARVESSVKGRGKKAVARIAVRVGRRHVGKRLVAELSARCDDGGRQKPRRGGLVRVR